MQDFRKLTVWQRNHKLTLAVYHATEAFPVREMFGLTQQMRKATTSVGANIAEGACRGSAPDFARFLQMGMGSAGELENFVLVARDLSFLSRGVACDLERDVVTVKRMLASFMARVRGA